MRRDRAQILAARAKGLFRMSSTSTEDGLRGKLARAMIPLNFFGVARSADSGKGMLRVTSGRFRPEIDGLRFFAIIPVLFSHLFEQVLRRQHQLGFLASIE